MTPEILISLAQVGPVPGPASALNWQTVVMSAIMSIFGGGASAGIVAKILDYKAAKRSSDSKDREADKNFEVLMMTKMQARIEKLEQDHQNCTETSLKMAIEIGALRERVASIDAKVEMSSAAMLASVAGAAAGAAAGRNPDSGILPTGNLPELDPGSTTGR